jgi:endo-1,3-1,4-beta-glycanase ExoK
MKCSTTLIRAALVLAISVQVANAAETQGTTFFDGFDSFDRTRWYVSDGWSNGDHQNCTWSRQAVTTKDGAVTLAFKPTGDAAKPFVCGEIQTNAVFGHGTFEARFRTDKASGINAAFFTYIGPVHKKPHDEIDFEVLTRDTSSVSLNTFVDGEPKNGTVIALPSPSDTNFHTYSFVWEPERLRWFIDGVLVHDVQGQDLPSNPQKIYFSHWGTGTLTDWMGPFTDPGRALTMDVDWVAYTAPGETCAFEGSVLCTAAMAGKTAAP